MRFCFIRAAICSQSNPSDVNYHSIEALELIREFYDGAFSKLKKRKYPSSTTSSTGGAEEEVVVPPSSSIFRQGLTKFVANICGYLDLKGYNLALARNGSEKKYLSAIETVAFRTCQFINKGHNISQSSSTSDPFSILPSEGCSRELATNTSLFPIKLLTIDGKVMLSSCF
jgi:hypothetical protein